MVTQHQTRNRVASDNAPLCQLLAPVASRRGSALYCEGQAGASKVSRFFRHSDARRDFESATENVVAERRDALSKYDGVALVRLSEEELEEVFEALAAEFS